MSNKIKDLILIGIFVCLLIIAFKPVPQMNISQSPTPAPTTSPGQTVIQLNQNRIAIVETNNHSGEFGSIWVFDYDGKSFKLLGKYNYSDYIRNPQKDNPVMPSLP